MILSNWISFLQDVPERFVAVIKLLDSGDKLKVDQDHLETVIPALGSSKDMFI